MLDRIRKFLSSFVSFIAVHAASIQSWSAVLLTAAGTLVAYGVVLPGHTTYRVLGGLIALLTVLAARSSAPPVGPDRP